MSDKVAIWMHPSPRLNFKFRIYLAFAVNATLSPTLNERRRERQRRDEKQKRRAGLFFLKLSKLSFALAMSVCEPSYLFSARFQKKK